MMKSIKSTKSVKAITGPRRKSERLSLSLTAPKEDKPVQAELVQAGPMDADPVDWSKALHHHLLYRAVSKKSDGRNVSGFLQAVGKTDVNGLPFIIRTKHFALVHNRVDELAAGAKMAPFAPYITLEKSFRERAAEEIAALARAVAVYSAQKVTINTDIAAVMAKELETKPQAITPDDVKARFEVLFQNEGHVDLQHKEINEMSLSMIRSFCADIPYAERRADAQHVCLYMERRTKALVLRKGGPEGPFVPYGKADAFEEAATSGDGTSDNAAKSSARIESLIAKHT